MPAPGKLTLGTTEVRWSERNGQLPRHSARVPLWN
jgi:hypothetical protein